MTADRFGPSTSGEFTAVSAARPLPGETDQPADAGQPARGGPRPSRSRDWRPKPPPQHGAWAFLAVPVLVGMAVAGWSPVAWLFLVAFLCAYPVGYYGGRALTTRVRRGSWTRLARRERDRALPWAVLLAAFGIPLVVVRPWLLLVALGLAVLWVAGLAVAARQGERSLANDLVLICQAVVGVPITVAIVAGPGAVTGTLAAATWTATALVGGYLIGSVLHVKSLLREAGNVGMRRVDVGWHAALAGAGAVANPWWLVGFGPALLRAVVAHPGGKPLVIGVIEAVVAVLVVVAAVLAT